MNDTAGEGALSSGSKVQEDEPLPKRGHFEFPIYGIDTDVRDRVTVRALFGYMQDAATRHAYALNMTPAVELVNGAWLLSRLVLTLGDRPTFPGQVVLKTWSGGVDGLRFLRGYRFYGQDGACFGEAASEWIVAERTNHRPLRPADIVTADIIREWTTIDPLTAKRLPRQGTFDGSPMLTMKRALDYSLIDRNLHVNNSVYAEMVLDAVARTFVDDNALLLAGLSPSRIDIYYARELRYGGDVTLDVFAKGGCSFFIRGLNDLREMAFSAHVEFGDGELPL